MSLKYNIRKVANLVEFTLSRHDIVLGKHKLLAEINRRQDDRQIVRLPRSERMRLFYLRFERKLIPRRAMVIGLALVLIISTSTGFMAQAAVPGDMLWPVKLTMEKAEVALAVDSAQEGRIHIRHVENRLKELSVITAQHETEGNDQKISQVVRRLEKDITAANQSLKISKEEKKDADPQSIVSLAKDLSAKASEAVKVLEENKKALSPESLQPMVTVDSLTGMTISSSTDALLDFPTPEQGTATTSPSPVIDASKTAEQKSDAIDLRQAIVEVQIINDYISYSALDAMIEMVERHGASNRSEVTGVLRSRVKEQQDRLVAIQDAVRLVNDNFILHRDESKTLVKKAHDLIESANAMASLDNLSGALRTLTEAKEVISRIAAVLQEVSNAGGLKSKPDKVQTPVPPKPIVKGVTIQTVQNAPTTTDASTPDAGMDRR